MHRNIGNFTRFVFIGLLLLIASYYNVAIAQETQELLSPFARGAGKTFSVSARGLDAIGLNPALLGLGEQKPFELQILPFASLGTNAGPTIVHLASIGNGFQDTNLSSQRSTVNGSTVGDSTREAIVDFLKDDKLSSAVSTRLLGLSYHNANIGTFGLTWTLHVALRAFLPDSLLSYIDTGAVLHLISQAPFGPASANLEGMAYSEYTLSFARNIIGKEYSNDLQLRGGIGLKYVAGIELLQLDPASQFTFNNPRPARGGSATIGAHYRIQFAYPDGFGANGLPTAFSLAYLSAGSAGSGFGGDIGLTLGRFDSTGYSPWQASISVSDIGSITWTKNTDVRYADTVITANFSTLSQGDTLNSKIKPIGGTLDTSDAPYTTSLPTTMHIGGSLDLASIGVDIPGGRLLAAVEYAIGLNNTVGAPNHGRFGISGILVHPSKGFSYQTALGFTTQEGTSDLTLGIGMGIGNSFSLELGTARLLGLFNSDANKDGVVSMKFMF